MAATQPRRVWQTPTPAQAAFDLKLWRLLWKHENLEPTVSDHRYFSGAPRSVYRARLDKSIRDVRQDCLRVKEHECFRLKGLRVVPKRKDAKWEPWWTDLDNWDHQEEYDLDDHGEVVGGLGIGFVCPVCAPWIDWRLGDRNLDMGGRTLGRLPLALVEWKKMFSKISMPTAS